MSKLELEPVRFFDEGWRLGLITARGRDYVYVLDCGALRTRRFKKQEERYFRPQTVSPTRLARMLSRRRSALVKRLKDREPGKRRKVEPYGAVRDVVRALREQ